MLFGGAIDCSFVCLFVCDDKYCFMRCCVQLPCSLCIYVTVLLYLGSLMSITCYYYQYISFLKTSLEVFFYKMRWGEKKTKNMDMSNHETNRYHNKQLSGIFHNFEQSGKLANIISHPLPFPQTHTYPVIINMKFNPIFLYSLIFNMITQNECSIISRQSNFFFSN